jgi:hypothetical protein
MEYQEAKRASLGISDQLFVVIVGGGLGGIGLVARLRRLEELTHALGIRGGSDTNHFACTIRCGTVTCHFFRSRNIAQFSRLRVQPSLSRAR